MLLQGILLGLSLSFLVGPLFFSVVEAGLSAGFRAGVAVAAGIWVSDVFFVALVLWSVETLAAITALEGFRFWASLFGGILLMAFGAGSFFSRTKSVEDIHTNYAVEPGSGSGALYLRLWLRGFLINTVNPGTIFFWLGIVSAVVAPNRWTIGQSLVFFGGMLGTLVLTDTLKAWGAKSIRKFLTPKHIRQMQRGIGLVLMVFGLVLIVKSF